MAVAKKSNRKTNRKRPAGKDPKTRTAWIVLVLAVVVVGVVVVLANLWGHKRTTPIEHKTRTDARSVKKPKEQAPAEKFEFYTLLPKQSNGPSVGATKGATGAESGQPRAPAESSKPAVQYVIQVGSFATPAEADRRKAEVAMLGYSSNVRSADVHGKTYYRVQIGPVADKDVGGVEKRLNQAKIATLVTKAP